jgi:hypothetical protein
LAKANGGPSMTAPQAFQRGKEVGDNRLFRLRSSRFCHVSCGFSADSA